MSTDIKAGDLLYAVGPSHQPWATPTGLRVYSTPVKMVRPEGSYSTSATPADLASATYAIELNSDRPMLGFPKCTYRNYEVGINVHRSAAEALQAFATQAQHRRTVAEVARDNADREVKWAYEILLVTTEVPHALKDNA